MYMYHIQEHKKSLDNTLFLKIVDFESLKAMKISNLFDEFCFEVRKKFEYIKMNILFILGQLLVCIIFLINKKK